MRTAYRCLGQPLHKRQREAGDVRIQIPHLHWEHPLSPASLKSAQAEKWLTKSGTTFDGITARNLASLSKR